MRIVFYEGHYRLGKTVENTEILRSLISHSYRAMLCYKLEKRLFLSTNVQCATLYSQKITLPSKSAATNFERMAKLLRVYIQGKKVQYNI